MDIGMNIGMAGRRGGFDVVIVGDGHLTGSEGDRVNALLTTLARKSGIANGQTRMWSLPMAHGPSRGRGAGRMARAQAGSRAAPLFSVASGTWARPFASIANQLHQPVIIG
jgi:hypothetical protein